VTPKKSARPVAELTPVKQEFVGPTIAPCPMMEEPPPFDEEPPKDAMKIDPSEHTAGVVMKTEPIAADIAASVLVAPVPADTIALAALASAETTMDALGAAGAMPADAVASPSLASSSCSGGSVGMFPAFALPPATDALGTASNLPADGATPPSLATSSSAGGPESMDLVPVVPAAAAVAAFAPSARFAIGCSSRKIGICGVEFARSGRSGCNFCNAKIPDKAVRFIYWHTAGKPPGFIHTHCIVGLALPSAELRENLCGLSPTEPGLKQAVVDAMAALEARAF
jgi:hypothetical protein